MLLITKDIHHLRLSTIRIIIITIMVYYSPPLLGSLSNNTLYASVTNDAHFTAYPAHVAPVPLQLFVTDYANVSTVTGLAPGRILALLTAQSNDGARFRHGRKRLEWTWLGIVQL